MMKIPKRLPESLEAYVKHMEKEGAELIAASMNRVREHVFISLTFTQTYKFTEPDLITAEFSLSYDRTEREFKDRFKDKFSAHRRSFNVFRKAVLAS